MNYSYEINNEFSNDKINFIISIVIDDIIDMIKGNNSQFLDHRYFYERRKLKVETETILPTTYCNFCHGINNKYINFNPKYMSIDYLLNDNLNLNNEKFIDREIKYKTGGFRSLSSDETKVILDKELGKFGTKVKIEEAIGNPFSDNNIIHCFNSFIEQTYNSNNRFLFRKNYGAGKGITRQQSYFSAGFELLEHAGLEYSGNIPIISAKYKDVRDYSIDLSKIINSIRNKNTEFDEFDEDAEIDWVVSKSLITNKNILVPAFLVFMYDVELKGMFFPITSSGAAIGITLEDATLHALLEAVERDSWLICQSNPYIMPIINYDTITNTKLKEIIYKIKEKGYDIVTRDYTTDLGIPTYRTWILNKNDYLRYAYNGLGCHVYGELALERSITEAVQVDDWSDTGGEIDSDMITLKVLDESLTNIYNQHYLVNKDIFGKTNKINDVKNLFEDVTSSYQCIKKLSKLISEKVNGDVLYVDMTKHGMDVKIVRTIITGDFQQMNIPLISASDRMFNFGINCGYSNRKTKYEELFMGKYAH